MAEKKTKIVVRVSPGHPTGSRNRAGMKFSTDPQQVSVTKAEKEMIAADKFLLIITKGTAYKQGIDAAKAKDTDSEGSEDVNSENNGQNDGEGSEGNDNDGKDESQGDDSGEGSDNGDSDTDTDSEGSEDSEAEEIEKPITKGELMSELTKHGVEFGKKDKLAVLEETLRSTIIAKLNEAEEEFSPEANIKDLIVLVDTL